MTTDQVRATIIRECRALGSQLAWARKHKISPAYVSDIVNARREPSERVCDALGLVRVVSYERK